MPDPVVHPLPVAALSTNPIAESLDRWEKEFVAELRSDPFSLSLEEIGRMRDFLETKGCFGEKIGR